MAELRPMWIEFPNEERKLIKVENDQRLGRALEPHLCGQDLELLRGGVLILHTPDGHAIFPNDIDGREVPPGIECIVMIDPERVVGG